MKFTIKPHKLGKKHLLAYLTLVVLTGFVIRYYPFLHKLTMDDSYFQYSLVKSILSEGRVPDMLSLSKFPQGKETSTVPLLFPYFIAFTYRIAAPFGVSLADYMIVFPAFFGALAVVPLYLLVEELVGRRMALVSSFIYVVLPASLLRTTAGFVEKEGLASIFIFLWLYFFIRSKKELKPRDPATYFLPLLSGGFMALSALTWNGSAYFALLLASAIFIQTMLKYDKSLAYSTAIMAIVGFGLMHLAWPRAFSLTNLVFQFRYATLGYVSVLALGTTFLPELDRITGFKLSPARATAIFLTFFTGFIILFGMHEKVVAAIVSFSRGLSGARGPTGVSEADRAVFYDYFDIGFSWLVFFIPPGGYYFLKEAKKNIRFEDILLGLWFITGVFASYLQIRLFYNLAPAAAIFIAFAFIGLIEPVLAQLSGGSRQKRVPNAKLEAGLLLLAMSLAVVGVAATDYKIAQNTKMSWQEHLGRMEEAMEYLREGTPKDSVVFSWWDYGYMIQGLGERATIVDPGISGRRRVDSTRLLISSEPEALEILRSYNPIDKPAYLLVTIREVFIQEAITDLAGEAPGIRTLQVKKSGDPMQDILALPGILFQKRSTIFWRNFPNEDYYQLIYLPNLDKPETAQNLLPRLLPFDEIPGGDPNKIRPFGYGEQLDHFNLIWDNKYVYIYEIV